MKNKSFIRTIITFCMIVPVYLLTTGCEDDKYDYYSLEISDNAYTFPTEGGEFTITVDTDYTEGWNAEITAEGGWVKKESETSGSITLVAEENPEMEIRTATVKITAGRAVRTVELRQLVSEGGNNANYFRIPANSIVYSPTGKLAAYITEPEEDNPADTYKLQAVNLVTGDTEILYESDASFSISGISDTGIAWTNISYNDGDYLIKDGQLVRPILPAGASRAEITDITADGTSYCGTVVTATINYLPVKWIDDSYIILDYPDYRRAGYGQSIVGAIPRGISPDGRIVYGQAWADNGGDAIYWTGDDPQWMWLGDLVIEEVTFEYGGTVRTQSFDFMLNVNAGSRGRMSPNGRYLATMWEVFGFADRTGTPGQVPVPCLYDFETNEMIVYFEDLRDATSTTVTNEGDMFLHTDDLGLVYNHETGKIESASEFIMNKYETYVAKELRVLRYSTDPEYVLGYQIGLGQYFYMYPKSK